MEETKKPKRERYLFSWWFLSLVLICVGLNIGLNRLFLAVKVPLIFDSFGTIIISAVSGPIGGMLTALISSSINMVFDTTSIYYLVVYVGLAALVAHGVKMGLGKKIWGIPLLAVSSAVLMSLLESFVFYYVSKGLLTFRQAAALAESFAKNGIPDFLALWFSTLLFELLDKTVSVSLVFLILRYMPDSLLAHFYHGHYFYKDGKDTKVVFQKINWHSIHSKVTLLSTLVNVILVIIIGSVSGTIYGEKCINNYSTLGQDYTNAMVQIISGDDVTSFLVPGQEDEKYKETEQRLYGLFNSCDKIEYMYVYKIEDDGCHVVFDLDTPDVQGSGRGNLVAFDEGFAAYLPALKAGEKINPIISEDAYGWLCSVYTPIYDSNMNTAAYACIDINMTDITADISSFLVRLLSVLLSFIVMFLCLTYYLTYSLVISPLNSLVKRTRDYKEVGLENWLDSPIRQKEDVIATNDEMEELYLSLSESEEAASQDYQTIEEQTAKMLMMERNIVLAMANMVESRDKNTGEHIKRTSSYVRFIADQMYLDKQYPDILTDDYRKNVILAAPLHDVGKIKISDAILNKPGKLNDEEFNEMKTHTIEGKKIIDMALEGITGNTYLEVARDMAAYHHEKWDGSGYMEGLKGQQIPLSARIMAVADVFDALVSKRSYKEPFSYQTAIDIIVKESGTHFDPEVIKAFLKVQDKVKEEMKANRENKL
jgi:HD-GYP domain-containing protein (c-di-GMP phosphodiesterase class II)